MNTTKIHYKDHIRVMYNCDRCFRPFDELVKHNKIHIITKRPLQLCDKCNKKMDME